MDNEASPPKVIKTRRKYSLEFKQRVIAESRQPGQSLASVAVRHGLNPNMVHKWRKTLKPPDQNDFLRLPSPSTRASALSVARGPGSPDTIRMEIPTPQGQLVVHWPVRQLPESIAWLRALTR